MLGVHAFADAVQDHAHAVGRRHQGIGSVHDAVEQTADDVQLLVAPGTEREPGQAVHQGMEAVVRGEARRDGVGRQVAIAIRESLECRLRADERLVHRQHARARAGGRGGSHDHEQRQKSSDRAHSGSTSILNPGPK
jgi:hypothetical protein